MPEPFVLKPNIKKVFIINLIKVMFALLILFIAYYLIKTVGADIMRDFVEYFEISVEGPVLLWFFIGAVFVLFLALILNYVSTAGEKYEFYPNKVVISKGRTIEVAYDYVSRVSYDNVGFENSLFNMGTIIIEFSGIREKQAKLEFIDNFLEKTRKIHDLINGYRLKKQAIYSEKARISSILDKEIFY